MICTLMKAGPARSIDLTRNLYHHSVPDLSLSCSGSLRPIHIAGTPTMSGTNMRTKCTNLMPVHNGSQMYESRKKTMMCPTLDNPTSSSDSLFSNSSREAANIRPSTVLSVPSLSFSESCTKAAGVRVAAAHKIFRPWLVGLENWHLRPEKRFGTNRKLCIDA